MPPGSGLDARPALMQNASMRAVGKGTMRFGPCFARQPDVRVVAVAIALVAGCAQPVGSVGEGGGGGGETTAPVRDAEVDQRQA